MRTRIVLCLLWCVVTILAQSTSTHLSTFYAKWGGKSSFPSGTVDGIETFLYGMDQFLAGDITSAKTRVDNFFLRFQGRSPYTVLQSPSPAKPGFFAGNPIAYSSLKMLKHTLDFAATKRISYAESGRRQHFVINIAVATCGVGKRATNLALTLEDIRVSIDPRVRANNYAGIRNSLQVFQAYLWAISQGAFVVDVVVKEITACAPLSVSSSGGRLRMGVLGDLGTYMATHVHPQTQQADMVLFVYPTNRPTAQVFKDQKVEIITGGSLVGSRAITIMSDDSWFVEKPPHLGGGEWTEVERRTYLPQWYQHEVFHYLFYKYPQFKMEVSGHDWFNNAFWPSDFVHGPDYLEADYFAACVNQRFIPRLNPGLGVGLLTSSPSPLFVQTNWAAINPTLAGSYVHTPTLNGYHRMTITKSGTNTWLWKNAAGVSWNLVWDSQKLTAPTSPYGPQTMSFNFARNSQGFFVGTRVVSITFNGETYVRTSSPSQAVLSQDHSDDSTPLSTSTAPPTFVWPELATTLILLLVCSTFWIVFFTWRTVSARLELRP